MREALPVCSGFPADHTNRPAIRLAVQLQLFSVMFTFAIYFNRLRRSRTRPQTLQVVQFGNQVLHQVVLGETFLIEHLKRGNKQTEDLNKTPKCVVVYAVLILQGWLAIVSK